MSAAQAVAAWVAILAQLATIIYGGVKVYDELGYLHRYQVGLGHQIRACR